MRRHFIKHRYYMLRALDRLGLGRVINVWHTLEYEGTKIKLPVICGLGAAEFIEGDGAVDELWMQPLLAQLTRKTEGTFIDVGANVGQALMKLKAARRAASWLGFEPNPLCVFFLHELIEANGWTNCQVVGAALADRVGVLPLYASSSTDASASIVEQFVNRSVQSVRAYVPILSLDDAIFSGQFDIDSVTAVKVDVEGAELEVSRGMRQLLSRYRPPVMLEVLPVFTKSNSFRLERQLALENYYRELGYRWLRVVKDLDRDRRLERLDPVSEIGVHGDRHACQYILLPMESYPSPLEAFLK
jgi:FkbM family methyltransferase